MKFSRFYIILILLVVNSPNLRKFFQFRFNFYKYEKYDRIYFLSIIMRTYLFLLKLKHTNVHINVILYVHSSVDNQPLKVFLSNIFYVKLECKYQITYFYPPSRIDYSFKSTNIVFEKWFLTGQVVSVLIAHIFYTAFSDFLETTKWRIECYKFTVLRIR